MLFRSLAGRYLLENGHRHLAVIAETNRSSGKLRIDGFVQSLKEEGIELDANLLIHSKSKIDDARNAAQVILNMKNRPTAVFAGTDLIATIFVNEARKKQVSVPNDISIVGFDNTIQAELADPGLTTIAQPIEELAQYAMQNLLKSVENPSMPGHRIMLVPELIERQSVKKLKVEPKTLT